MGRAPPWLRVQLLGELRCWQGEALIAPQQWKTSKVRALFALLLSERGQIFSQAQLAKQLWPDSEDGLALVRRRISDLRHILEPGLKRASLSQYILRRSHGYCFSPKVQCWVDIEEFARAEEQGREREHARDWPAAIEAYKRAAQLYQGEFLAGDESDWVLHTRSYWRERFLYVMSRLAECYSQLGQYGEALAACRHALQVDPLYEEGHYQLMLYHAQRGESVQALKVYEDYRLRLARELGLSLSAQMEELRRRIIQGAVPGRAQPLVLEPPPSTLALLPFVGREAERAQLRKRLHNARSGHGPLVLLSEEPGVGKTRLAQEVLREMQSMGALVLWGRCREGIPPYLPLAEALRDQLPALQYRDVASIKPVWLAEIAALVPEMRTLLPQIPQNPALDSQQAQWRFFEAVAQFLTGLTQSLRFEKPLVLWLDDLQWAAMDLLDLLEHLCRRIAQTPICIIGAYRSTEITPKHPLHKKLVVGCKQSHHVVLSRLSYAEIERSLAQLGLQSTELCRSLYHESQGNPLFLTVILRALCDKQIVTVASDGRWVCKKKISVEEFSARELKELVQQRLARLSPSEHRVLQYASVLGESFSEEFMRQLWGNSGGKLSRSLSALANAGLLTLIGPGLRYDFTHDRFREIVYDEIPLGEKKLLHRRVAQAIERVYSPDLEGHSRQLAFHYDRAQEWQHALRYSLRALERAIAEYHHNMALQMAEISLRAAKKLAQPKTLFQILLKRIAIYHRLGMRAEQKRDIEALFELKSKLGEKLSVSLEIEAYRAQAIFCRAVGCYREGIEAVRQMLTLLQKTQDRSQEVKALLLLGSCYWVWGKYARALQYAQRARALSKAINDQESLGDALHLLGQIHAHTGAHRDAGRYYRFALQVRRKIGDQSGVAYSTNNLSNHYRAVGDYQKAFDLYRHALALYEEIGNEQGRGRVLSDMADLYCKLGSYEKSLQYAQEAFEIQEAVRDLNNKAQTLIVKGHALEGLGQLKKALQCYQQAQALFERVKDVRGVCHALNSIGSVQLKLAQLAQRVNSRTSRDKARRCGLKVSVERLGNPKLVALATRHEALRSYAAALSQLKAIGARDVQIESLTGMGLAYLKRKKKAQALACTQQAVDLLERGLGHIAPQETYFAHSQALRAHGCHAAAKKYLRKAYEELMHRAQTVRDRTLRESFLNRVKMNCTIIEAWKSTLL